MKKQALLGLAFFAVSAMAWSQVNVGVNVGAGGDSFHMAIGSYYNVPPAQVAVFQQRHIPDEEMPVVFFLAKRVHVAPGVIVDLRAGGLPWVEIFHRYHVNPRVLYVPIHGGWAGTPYAGFYGYYRGDRRGGLVDADIVNMVNLRFASEYYHRTPDEVVRLRASGRDYRYIHNQYHQPRHDTPKGDRGHDRRDNRRNDRRDDHRDDRRDGDGR